MTNVAYSALPKYYDKLMTDYDYDYAFSLIKPYVVGNVVDVGCGSGKFAVEMSRMGANVIGIDNSQEMLNVANKYARSEGRRITFLCQSVVDMVLPPRYNLVTAMCDVFNYLLMDNDVDRALVNIGNCLLPQGKFVFDISSENKLKGMCESGQYFYDSDDITYLWQNTLDGDKINMDIAFFETQDGKHYIRNDEYHTQRMYSIEKLEDLLNRNNFDINNIMDKGDRIYVIATKR